MQALSQLSYTPTGPSHITQMTYAGNKLAEWTGLEPATPGVTGRYSNQLNYHSWQAAFACSGVATSQAKRYNLATLRGFEPRYSP